MILFSQKFHDILENVGTCPNPVEFAENHEWDCVQSEQSVVSFNVIGFICQACVIVLMSTVNVHIYCANNAYTVESKVGDSF